jgi:hypothetical protein
VISGEANYLRLRFVAQMLNNSAGCGVFSIQQRYRALKELRLPAGRQVKKIHVVERKKKICLSPAIKFKAGRVIFF